MATWKLRKSPSIFKVKNGGGSQRSSLKQLRPDMSNTIEGDIDIDFLGVLTLTIDIELVTFE